MQKKVLSEQALYYGDVAMPKDWDIDRDKLQQDILTSHVTDSPFPFSRTWDMLNTYMRDYFNLEYGVNLINKDANAFPRYLIKGIFPLIPCFQNLSHFIKSKFSFWPVLDKYKIS